MPIGTGFPFSLPSATGKASVQALELASTVGLYENITVYCENHTEHK
jgi:hypothetical protein